MPPATLAGFAALAALSGLTAAAGLFAPSALPMGLGALSALAAALGVVDRTILRPLAAQRAREGARLRDLQALMAEESAAERAATQAACALAKSEAAAAAGEREARAALAHAIGAAVQALAEGDLTAQLNTPAFPSEFAAARALYGKTLFALACSAAAIGGRARDILRETEALAGRARVREARLAGARAALSQTEEALSALIDERRQARVVSLEPRAAIEDTAGRTRIGALAERIDGFALQSRILALNVGIEAARAGDAGRGMAVIGQELRALSQRSAEAARELTQALGALGGDADARRPSGSDHVRHPRKSGDPEQTHVPSPQGPRFRGDDGTCSTLALTAPPSFQEASDLHDLFACIEAAVADAARDAQASEAIGAGSRAIAALAAKLEALAGQFRLPGHTARPALAPPAEPRRRA